MTFKTCVIFESRPANCVRIAKPKIHETVFRRIKVWAYAYAPVGLPRVYDTVAYNPATGDHDIRRDEAALPETIAGAIARHRGQLAIVWSKIWRGRGVYFLTVLASLYLVLYPFILTIPRDGESTTRLRALSDIITLLSIPLPNAADRWFIPYDQIPPVF